MSTDTLSVRVPKEHKEQIQRLAEQTGERQNDILAGMVSALLTDPESMEVRKLARQDRVHNQLYNLLRVNHELESRWELDGKMPPEVRKKFWAFMLSLQEHLKNELVQMMDRHQANHKK